MGIAAADSGRAHTSSMRAFCRLTALRGFAAGFAGRRDGGPRPFRHLRAPQGRKWVSDSRSTGLRSRAYDGTARGRDGSRDRRRSMMTDVAAGYELSSAA